MATQVTQCPKCHTSFRVTEAQLSIANGAVRCGSCLHIFNAPDHWLGPQAVEKPAAKPTPPPPPAPKEELIEDELLQDEPAEQPSALKSLDDEPEPRFNDTIEQNVIDNIFEDDLELEQLALEDDDVPDNADPQPRHSAIGDSIDAAAPTEDDDDDLLISDDMLDDDDFEDNKSIRDTGQQSIIQSIDDDNPLSADFERYSSDDDTGDFSESFLDIDNWEKDDKGVFKDLDELGEDSIGSEEDWAKKLMEDDDDASSSPQPTRKSPPPRSSLMDEIPDAQINDALIDDELIDDDLIDDALIDDEPQSEPDDDPFKDIFDDLDTDESEESLDAELRDILNERQKTPEAEPPAEDEFILGDEPLMAGERIGNEKMALLANIEPEPVVFSTTLDRGRWIRIGWAACIVLAALLFGVQYVSFNFERLARDNSYRGLLTSVCGIVGCEIPDRDDIAMIRSTNLMVRSHPKQSNALVVDAIITNRATFKQRFPEMELQFTDLSGKIVAARQFTPKEYLEGELVGMTQMPSNQPIHVSLEIVDPGESAVNYQMRLQPNKNR